jgi:presqualene diphosphate synthase
MSALSRVCPDEFTIAMLATVTLGFLLPCRGTSAGIFGGLAAAVAEDAKRHRLYLPRELLHAHGIFATMPSWVLAQRALPDVCRDLAVLAERHYAAAAEAIAACPRSTMRPAAVMLGMYRALLHELLARGWQRLDEPVRIPFSRKLALLLRHGLTGR